MIRPSITVIMAVAPVAVLASTLGFVDSRGQQSPPAATQAARPSTLVPVDRKEDWWVKRHEASLARVKQGQVDLVFIGDSITQGWEGAGKEIWARRYEPRHAVNLGFSGDRTQHVLWRLQHGEIDGIAPKLAIVMIGTNNSNGNDNTAQDIGAGIVEIVHTLREKLPQTKVLLLAIFPRGEAAAPANAQREKNARASEIAAHAADGKWVHYLDIGPKFLQADGTMSKEIMPDFLHPGAKGYEIWADAIEAKVKELMGEGG